jgi:hypothetical protein
VQHQDDFDTTVVEIRKDMPSITTSPRRSQLFLWQAGSKRLSGPPIETLLHEHWRQNARTLRLTRAQATLGTQALENRLNVLGNEWGELSCF